MNQVVAWLEIMRVIYNERRHECVIGFIISRNHIWCVRHVYTYSKINSVHSSILFDSHPVAVLKFERTGTQCTTRRVYTLGYAMRILILEYWCQL